MAKLVPLRLPIKRRLPADDWSHPDYWAAW
jgi:hypothetical protein